MPVKIKKGKIKKRYFNYLVPVTRDDSTILKQRKGKGIWQNLFEFPLLESEKELDLDEVEKNITRVLALKDTYEIYLHNKEKIIHKLSHQHLHTKFWIVKTADTFDNQIPIATLQKYPVPVLLADFIKTFKI